MISYSLDKPTFIKVLLDNVGTHIDPRKLVERIEPGMRIRGLKGSLIQILRDYNLQVSLQEGCKKILVSDCYSLVCRRVKTAARGVHVSRTSKCPACSDSLVCSSPELLQDLVTVNCGHTYHAACLQTLQQDVECSLCCKSGQLSTHSTYYQKF